MQGMTKHLFYKMHLLFPDLLTDSQMIRSTTNFFKLLPCMTLIYVIDQMTQSVIVCVSPMHKRINKALLYYNVLLYSLTPITRFHIFRRKLTLET